MTKNVAQVVDVRVDYQVRRGAVKHESGLTVIKLAKAIFDTAGNDSSGVSNKTIAAHGLGIFIPANAVITRAWYQVKTTFADGASNNATIALSIANAGDLVTAIAISDASTPWTAGMHGTKAGAYAERTVAGDTAILDAASQAGSWLGPLSAEKEIVATVAVHALTAGRGTVYVEYHIAE